MATIKRFEDIEAWKKARIFDNKIFKLSESGKLSRDFALRNQMRKSSGSIMDNIAEGFERGGKGEFIQFLSIAKASSGELRSQLYRMLDREYFSEDEFNQFKNELEEISKMIRKFISYLFDSGLKGSKYKKH